MQRVFCLISKLSNVRHTDKLLHKLLCNKCQVCRTLESSLIK